MAFGRPAESQTTPVRLFYLGGLVGRGSGKTVNKVSSGDRVYALPSIGDYIEVPLNAADDLIRKHKYSNPSDPTQYFDIFTRDARLAAQVKAGRINPFATGNQSVIAAENAVKMASDEELEKELERRRAAKKKPSNARIDSDEDEGGAEDEGQLPSLSKPAASKKVPAKPRSNTRASKAKTAKPAEDNKE